MCVHRLCFVWLWTVECACTDGMLYGFWQVNVRAQTVFVWLWTFQCACIDGVFCGCGQFNVRAETV